MAVLDPESLIFIRSGGSANTNQHQSFGGLASIIQSPGDRFGNNALHNLFDEVQISESQSGDYEYRHMYIRNFKSHELRNVRVIMINNTQKSSYSIIKLAKGTSDVNISEQTILDENTPPVGLEEADWKVPTSADPIVFGTLPSGAYASLWWRRQVFPGALIAADQTCTIRVLGDPPPPLPPGGDPDDPCPTGQHRDPITNICVDDDDTDPGGGCPDGQHVENGICVPDDDGQGGGGGGNPPTPARVIATAVGDLSCSSAADQVLGGIGGVMDDPDFGMDVFIANGDLSYTSSIDCFVENLEGFELSEVTKITIGNHDDEEDESSQIRDDYIAHFGMNDGGFQSFDIQHVHFLLLDTQQNYDVGSAQHQFVLSDLEATKNNSDIGWIIVSYHKPSLTAPSDHAALTDFRDIYHPIFDQYKVDVIIQSHNHGMQRSYPIKYNASSPQSPTVMSTEPTHYTNVDGRIFVVSGGGGRSHYSIDSQPNYMTFTNDSDYGFFLMEWFDDQNSMVGYFMAAGDEFAESIHAFQINKGSGPDPGGGGGGVGGGGSGTGGGTPASADPHKIQWLASTGARSIISQSRNESADDRWSGNVTDVKQYGYETTMILSFSGTNSSSHFAMKHWGPNHSGNCGYQEGSCCCWYDTGIRHDGAVQLQIERPHPNNDNFTLTLNPTTGPLYMDNIGIVMEGNTIGLKWIIYPVVPGGDVDNGGIHLEMWVDTNPLTGNVPNNNWVKVYSFNDTGSVLGDYPSVDEQDLEIRNSDTNSQTAYAGGLHVRKRVAADYQ